MHVGFLLLPRTLRTDRAGLLPAALVPRRGALPRRAVGHRADPSSPRWIGCHADDHGLGARGDGPALEGNSTWPLRARSIRTLTFRRYGSPCMTSLPSTE